MHIVCSSRSQACAISAAALLMLGAASLASAQTAACGVPVPGRALPDFVVNQSDLANRLTTTIMVDSFRASDCEVREGFVSGRGKHTLLRFTSTFGNIGAGDLVIGDPAACGNLFEYSSCHGHAHFKEYADYRLWRPQGYNVWLANRNLYLPTTEEPNASLLAAARANGDLVSGNKMGFCMIDTTPYGSNQPAKYLRCNSNQGVSAGWGDSYGAHLDGQWIEIDRVKDGDYVLENHVNAEHLLPEVNYTNNSTAVSLRIVTRSGKKQVSNIAPLP